MKHKLLFILLLNSALVQAREVELKLHAGQSQRIKIVTLPDTGSVTLEDFNVTSSFTVSIAELEEKIPELSLPPRGKGIDVSGIYHCTNTQYPLYPESGGYFSVHHHADKFLIINISQDKFFLTDTQHLPDREIFSIRDFCIYN